MRTGIKVLSVLLAVLIVSAIGLGVWAYSIYKGVAEEQQGLAQRHDNTLLV